MFEEVFRGLILFQACEHFIGFRIWLNIRVNWAEDLLGAAFLPLSSQVSFCKVLPVSFPMSVSRDLLCCPNGYGCTPLLSPNAISLDYSSIFVNF